MQSIARLFRRAPEPSALTARIFTAYRSCHGATAADYSVLWDGLIGSKQRDIHDAIMKGEPVPALDDPASSYLFYGFDNMFADITANLKASPSIQEATAAHCSHQIVMLAEALGAKNIWNPEGGHRYVPGNAGPETEPIEDLLDKIEVTLGFKLEFPNPFPDEFGLRTSRGIASYRAMQALYQAARIKQLTKQYGNRVIEVGAGLGRTAYYAYLMGVKDYTIIDLPMTNVSQANFLGRVLSPDSISLFGEKRAGIRILPISEIGKLDAFDVMANVDSLTEMGLDTMKSYVSLLAQKGKVLWSVNHEANEHTVAELPGMASIVRFPYWLRQGYVEELFIPSH